MILLISMEITREARANYKQEKILQQIKTKINEWFISIVCQATKDKKYMTWNYPPYRNIFVFLTEIENYKKTITFLLFFICHYFIVEI